MQGKTVIGSSGSGAIISSNGYIVTNAHVVDLTRKTDQEIADAAFEQLAYDVGVHFGVSTDVAYRYLIERVAWKSVTRIQKVFLPSGESFDSDVKVFGAPVGEGKDVAVIKIDGKNLPTLQLGNSDSLRLQDDIWVIGYPAAGDSDLLSPESQFVSTINGGQISATEKKSAQGSPVIQISAAATHGNSGGPIVDANGFIVGLLTFRGDTVNGNEVQGFTFGVPATTIQEFVAQSGAKNAESTIDKLYKEGLNFFWAGYYKEALDKFEKVQRLYPKHSEITNLIREAQAKADKSLTYWPKYTLYFYIYDGVAALFIILLLLFTFAFKPKSQAAAVSASTTLSTSSPNKADDMMKMIKDGEINMQEVIKTIEEQMKKKKDEQKE
nr:serine protease [Bacillus sp. 165]